jgi:hypothetical protein
MIAAAPEGTPPRRIGDKNQKNSFPTVPQRGPDAGVFCIQYDFHNLDVNRIDSCLILPDKKMNKKKDY